MKQQRDCLAAEIQKFKDCDPEVLESLKKEIALSVVGANRSLLYSCCPYLISISIFQFNPIFILDGQTTSTHCILGSTRNSPPSMSGISINNLESQRTSITWRINSSQPYFLFEAFHYLKSKFM